jgi:predicted nucleic acid-binding protein
LRVVCVDASVIVQALRFGGPSGELVAHNELVAPHLIDLEVTNALRRRALARELSSDEAGILLEVYTGMQIERYAHVVLLPRIWELRHNVKPYDASYIALAETLELPFVTLDNALAHVPGSRAVVEVLPLSDE